MPSIVVIGTKEGRDDTLRAELRTIAKNIPEPIRGKAVITFVESDTTQINSGESAPFAMVYSSSEIAVADLVTIANLFIDVVDVELYWSQMKYNGRGNLFPDNVFA
jgi:hypothetical protein